MIITKKMNKYSEEKIDRKRTKNLYHVGDLTSLLSLNGGIRGMSEGIHADDATSHILESNKIRLTP